MLERFIGHIREKNILDFESHYLLAISGGLDSTVLAMLLHQSGIAFSMAHCNFNLRAEESDGDEAFVKQLGKHLGIRVYVQRFDTKAYAKIHGLSTQMAARNLRYKWFDELSERENLDGLIVAHHADDQLETILLNLLRGTGIEGIYGMAESREKIIRPLLPFSRAAIAAFAVEQGYTWREDSSNASIDYKRNYLRHEVVPRLTDFDQAALSLLQHSFDRIKDTGKAFFHLYDSWLDSNVKQEGQFSYLPVAALEKAPGKKSLLFYWLRPYGFKYAQMDDVVLALDRREPGKAFLSGTYSLNMDRDCLIIGPYENEWEEKSVEPSDIAVRINQDEYDLLILDQLAVPGGLPSEAMLDRDRLNFPLKIRRWQQGDKFRPLGMKNFKKVSDLLIDLKVPLIRKPGVKVLCSGDDIVWVIGIRIDDRYKITPLTKSALYFKKRKPK